MDALAEKALKMFINLVIFQGCWWLGRQQMTDLVSRVRALPSRARVRALVSTMPPKIDALRSCVSNLNPFDIQSVHNIDR